MQIKSIYRYIKNTSKKFKVIYLVLGLFFYILVGWHVGLTRLTGKLIENKSIFSDHVDVIHYVYKNRDDDYILCVTGNHKNYRSIEFLVNIPYGYYKYNEENYNTENYGFSTVPHREIVIKNCKNTATKGINSYPLIELVEADAHQKAIDILNNEIDIVLGDTIFLLKSNVDNNLDSELHLISFNEKEKLHLNLRFKNVHYPDLVSPIWKLFYIPAILIDILLWPLYLPLFFSLMNSKPK